MCNAWVMDFIVLKETREETLGLRRLVDIHYVLLIRYKNVRSQDNNKDF